MGKLVGLIVLLILGLISIGLITENIGRAFDAPHLIAQGQLWVSGGINSAFFIIFASFIIIVIGMLAKR